MSLRFEILDTAKGLVDKVFPGEKETTKESSVDTGYTMLSFPSSLKNEKDNPHSSYLIFHVVEPILGNDNSSGKSMKARQESFLKNPASEKSLSMIQMHMPAIIENLSHDYAKSDTTVLDDLIDVASTGLANGAKAAGAELGSKVSDRVIQNLLNNPSMTRKFGEIHKQRHALLYGGTNLRQQTFLYTLRPRNLDELKEIGKIIYIFRKYSCGTAGELSSAARNALDSANISSDGIDSYGTVKVPKLWYVEERLRGDGGDVKRYTDRFAFGPAVITNVRVNKTPDQVYATIAGTAGDPAEIELEITMQEMIPIYSDFWDMVRGS